MRSAVAVSISRPVNSSCLAAAGPSSWPTRSSDARRVDDAELGRGDAEAGAVDGDAQVAVDGDRAAAADAVALDVGDGRLGHRRQRVLGAHVHLEERRRARRALGEQVADVGTGAEVTAGAAHHDDAHRRVGAEPPADVGRARPTSRTTSRCAWPAGRARSWPPRRPLDAHPVVTSPAHRHRRCQVARCARVSSLDALAHGAPRLERGEPVEEPLLLDQHRVVAEIGPHLDGRLRQIAA